METGYFISTIVPFLIKLIPIAAAIVLAITAWQIRMLFIQQKYILNMEWVLLKISVPRDVYKSPQAMELVLQSMYQTYPGHWYDVYVQGIVRNWFSLEIISIEGKLHFLMYIPKFYKNLIESQIYAQYPNVEIDEVSDYTKMIPLYRKGVGWDLYGYEFGVKKSSSWPIKTYINYELDKAVGSLEETEKIDPLTTLLELLGSIGPGEQIWIQILIRGSTRPWKKEGQKLIDGIKAIYFPKDKTERPIPITREIQNAIDAIDRKIGKMGFDCGMRGLYIARKENFSISTRVALRGVFNAFGSEHLNSFRRPLSTALEWPWKRIMKFRVIWRKERIFKAYRKREFFYFPYWTYFWPYSPKPFVLNTEELATLFHFPGGVSETPTFKRIEFKKAEPPSELPI